MIRPAVKRALIVALPTCIVALLIPIGGIPVHGQDGVDLDELEAAVLISAEDFLRDLRDDIPDLAPARAAVERDDLDAAIAAYIEYFRTRSLSHPLMMQWEGLEREPQSSTDRADETLAGFLRDGYNVHQVPEEGLDWHNSPLVCLTRFPYLPAVLRAAYDTQEPRYVRFAVDHLLEYMQNWPMSEFIGKGVQGFVDNETVIRPWHWSIMCHRPQRMGEVLNYARGSEHVTDRELFDLLHRLYQESIYIRNYMHIYVDKRHNGGLGYIRGLAVSCEVLDDFEAAREWRRYNAQSVKQYISESFYPDGMCIELTQAYSRGVAASSQTLALMLKDDPEVQQLFPLMEAIAGWAIGVGKPTGRLPSFGDLHAGSFASALNMELIDLLDVPWVRTIVDGTDGPLPPATVWPWPGEDAWGGLYAMRSDWSREALYMCLDGGPWGTSHAHGDRLSFVVSAHGADFIIDPPSTRYRSNEPGAFISRQMAGFLHNIVTVDGVDQFMRAPDENGQLVWTVPREATEPLDNIWEHGDDYTLWVADYSFEPLLDARWERRVVFADRSYWLMQDVVTGEGFGGPGEPVALEQNFQFAEDIEIEFDGTTTIATAPGGARLVLLPLTSDLEPTLSVGDTTPGTTYWPYGEPRQDISGASTQDRPHGRGWVGRADRLHPAPAVTYVGRAPTPVTITVVIIPLAPGEALADLPAISFEATDGGTAWRLPVSQGALLVTSTVEGCAVGR